MIPCISLHAAAVMARASRRAGNAPRRINGTWYVRAA